MAIAAAVAQALAGSRRSSSVSLGSANREPEYADGPAEYNFEYKVADDEQQNYIARQESRDGDTVTGSYNYVNPAGTLVTVNYEAAPEGFKQETSEQKGAVEMRKVPVGWDGPLAGVDDQAVSSGVFRIQEHQHLPVRLDRQDPRLSPAKDHLRRPVRHRANQHCPRRSSARCCRSCCDYCSSSKRCSNTSSIWSQCVQLWPEQLCQVEKCLR